MGATRPLQLSLLPSARSARREASNPQRVPCRHTALRGTSGRSPGQRWPRAPRDRADVLDFAVSVAATGWAAERLECC